MTKQINVEWTTTETFKETFDVEDDFDITDTEAVDDLICALEQEELDECYDGITERQITHVEKRQ